MHVPLADVESGCVSVFDENRNPINIRVTNSVDFDETGEEICWHARNCDPVPWWPWAGGPGDARIMDVSFEGDPSLCGVYIVRLTSWSGCIWDLFANCDGSSNDQFQIYDDLCEARNSVKLLPEMVLQNLDLSDGGGCAIDYCVDVQNIGCREVTAGTLRVSTDAGTTDQAVYDLDAGETRRICGQLDVSQAGQSLVYDVTAEIDPDHQVEECTETSDASSCTPATGWDILAGTIEVDCTNIPPVCASGGPYMAECESAAGITAIQLDGTGSFDPDSDSLSFSWATDCPDSFLDDPSSPTPVLNTSAPHCSLACGISLTVTDLMGLEASCSSTVTIQDTTPPVMTGVPADLLVECGSVPLPAIPVAEDRCDSNVGILFAENRTDGPCPGSYSLVRTWIAQDFCGNATHQSQIITVQDTQGPTLLFDFEPVPATDDEDDDGWMDDTYVVRFWGEDTCSSAVSTEARLDVYGGDATCEDENPDFAGYEMLDGDLIRFHCDEDADCVLSPKEDPDEDADQLPPVKLAISGPALKLSITGMDECENTSHLEGVKRCPDPRDCMSALTLQNSQGEEETFYWYDFTGGKTLFEVGGETGEFWTNCSRCLSVGDRSGSLIIASIEAGTKLAKRCRMSRKNTARSPRWKHIPLPD